MKKLFLNILGFVLVIGTMTSCGKTTKGKFTNEWNVTAVDYSYVYNDSYNNGGTTDSGSESSSVNGSQINYSNPNKTGKISSFKITIDKDGSWKEELVYTETENIDDYQSTGEPAVIEKNTNIKTNGTWNLLGKNKSKDLKKNEVVVFSNLKVSVQSTTKTTFLGVTSTDGENTISQFANGFPAGLLTINQVGDTWKIEESSRKKLVMSINDSYSYYFKDGTGVTDQTSNTKTTITLEPQ